MIHRKVNHGSVRPGKAARYRTGVSRGTGVFETAALPGLSRHARQQIRREVRASIVEARKEAHKVRAESFMQTSRQEETGTETSIEADKLKESVNRQQKYDNMNPTLAIIGILDEQEACEIEKLAREERDSWNER